MSIKRKVYHVLSFLIDSKEFYSCVDVEEHMRKSVNYADIDGKHGRELKYHQFFKTDRALVYIADDNAVKIMKSEDLLEKAISKEIRLLGFYRGTVEDKYGRVVSTLELVNNDGVPVIYNEKDGMGVQITDGAKQYYRVALLKEGGDTKLELHIKIDNINCIGKTVKEITEDDVFIHREVIRYDTNFSSEDDIIAKTSTLESEESERLNNHLALMGLQGVEVDSTMHARILDRTQFNSLTIPNGVRTLSIGRFVSIKELILPKSCKEIYGIRSGLPAAVFNTGVHRKCSTIDLIDLGGVEKLGRKALEAITISEIKGLERIKRACQQSFWLCDIKHDIDLSGVENWGLGLHKQAILGLVNKVDIKVHKDYEAVLSRSKETHIYSVIKSGDTSEEK